jgi:hypothetical protein
MLEEPKWYKSGIKSVTKTDTKVWPAGAIAHSNHAGAGFPVLVVLIKAQLRHYRKV